MLIMTNEKRLLIEIEELRTVMSQTVSDQGLSCPESIRLSQQLDSLMNLYEKERQNGKRKIN
ncbi:aspartyl-phosphate phosphatase Spo0E family protein [Lentibacillus saliphilus]|uniref:aspartyl-phosphate phosphatase Spo0E family protein n=1 Tax=Lentibacillus saliphilus TaxID=2737028 RepID=UPI001C2F36C4|nr:aspartyl-phosphate phosphatase Spo0E family protein [Lentibacillus saliphilus]